MGGIAKFRVSTFPKQKGGEFSQRLNHTPLHVLGLKRVKSQNEGSSALTLLVGGSHSFRLTANNVGLLRNTTTVTVSRNDGGKDAYAAVRAIDHLERD